MIRLQKREPEELHFLYFILFYFIFIDAILFYFIFIDAFQDQHTNTLEHAARRGSSLQRLLRRPVRPVPWSGQTGRRRQNGDEAYER